MANKFINELNGIESVAVGDELPIWDSSESDTRKTTISKLSSALTVNLVGEGISAPPSSNAVANAIKNTNAVLHVETLPTSPDIKNVIYHNTTDGKYYVGNKTTQTTSELNTDSTVFIPVDTIADGNMNPVTSNAVYDELYPATPSTPTPITTGVCGNVSWSSCTITRYGNLVQFTIDNLQIPNGAAGTVGQIAIATGFPPPKLRTFITCMNLSTVEVGYLKIVNNGNVGQLCIDNGMNTNGASAYLSGMYIARD